MTRARPVRGRVSLPVQADPTTCGIAALAAVAARAGIHPAYLDAPRARQVEVQRALHARAARLGLPGGLPWPQAWGTSPWALAALAGEATGLRYRILVWGVGARRALDEARARGEDSFLYVGGATVPLLGRWGLDLVPRHVVAVLGDSGHAGAVTVFEPTSGRVREVPRGVLDGPGPLPGPEFGHWPRPLLIVTPHPFLPRHAPEDGRPH